MSIARTNPEILDEPLTTKPVTTALGLPMVSLTKKQIAQKVDGWLKIALEMENACDLYVLLKQYEEAVSIAIDQLKPTAFESIGKHLGGQNEGEILGHKVRLSWPEKWIYSENVTALIEQQKLELKAAQAAEQANGKAEKITELGRITVTFRKEN